MRVLAASLFVISSLFVSIGHAEDTQKKLYKISFDPKEKVFAEGFPIAGDDSDFLHFVAGSSVREGRARFIPLFDHLYVVMERAEQIANANPGTPLYVYEVRQTPNFYNVMRSLQFASTAIPDPETTLNIRHVMEAERHSLTYAWAATSSITSDQIAAVYIYGDRHNPRGLTHLADNEDYIFAPAQVNPQPLPVRNETLNNLDVAVEPHGAGYMAAFVANIPCDPQSKRLGTSSSSHQCTPLENLPIETVYQRTIAKMIAAGILMGSTSGQLWSAPGHDEL
ncbi:hypothetical protein CGLAMM_11530 [Acetobacteraceae bacterium EV16G]|uniref:Pertussis toxin subunit 1 n=3 Tax=Sorlinia euscelidii TaxID=3081148 RepID=A0ABU7U3G6_9PROT